VEYVIDLRWYLCKSSGTEAILDNHRGDGEEFFTLASRLQRQNETVGLALLHHFLLKFASSFRFSSLNTLPLVICDMAIIASATFLATIAALTAHLLGVRSNQEEHEQTRAELKTIQTALRCLSVVEPVQLSLFILDCVARNLGRSQLDKTQSSPLTKNDYRFNKRRKRENRREQDDPMRCSYSSSIVNEALSSTEGSELETPR